MAADLSVSPGASMGVLELLRRHCKIVLGIGLIAVSAGVIAAELAGGSSSRAGPQQRYFTTDDGKTLFGDVENQLPPFDHNGQQAVQAHVYMIGGNRTVAYLERFSPDAHRILSIVSEAVKTAHPGDKPPKELAQVDNAQRNGREVKRPGDKQWVSIQSREGAAIAHVRAPDGGGNPVELNP